MRVRVEREESGNPTPASSDEFNEYLGEAQQMHLEHIAQGST
jgi:hypothetical protein